MITAEEKFRGQSGGLGEWQISYVVIGDGEHDDMTREQAQQAANDASPDSVGDIWRQDITIDEWIVTPASTIAFVTVSYGTPESEALGGGGAESTFEFRYQAPSGHVFRALATRAYTVASDGSNVSSLAASVHPHIRLVKNDRGQQAPEGVDLPGGNTTHIFRRQLPPGAVTSQYQETVKSLMGGVNNAPYKGAAAGEVRLVSCDSQTLPGNRGTSVTWGFDHRDNVEVTAGEIKYSQGGHEYAWDLVDGDKVDSTNNILVPNVKAIIVQQLFPLVNFNSLGA